MQAEIAVELEAAVPRQREVADIAQHRPRDAQLPNVPDLPDVYKRQVLS